MLRKRLCDFKLDYHLVPVVKRGLSYYVEDGFEVECDRLGPPKQIAGGGRYAEGIGWAIGLDRLLLALSEERPVGGSRQELLVSLGEDEQRANRGGRVRLRIGN